MPFSPFPRAPLRPPLPPRHLRREVPLQPAHPPGTLAREQVRLATEPDPTAALDWAAHVAAGRIGMPAPAPSSAPPPAGCDYGLASLAAILAPGIARRPAR